MDGAKVWISLVNCIRIYCFQLSSKTATVLLRYYAGKLMSTKRVTLKILCLDNVTVDFIQ